MWVKSPESIRMLSALISNVNSLIYTLLAFVIPLYFSIKALLRQYTVIIVQNGNNIVTSSSNDDSEVPSTFITLQDTSKTSADSNAGSPSVSSAWLHYWAIIAVVHCFTGIYERAILPIVGNSLIYHCAKYFGIFWLSKDDAIAARTLWNGLIGPFVSKYESDVDALIQDSKQKARALMAQSIKTLRSLSSKSQKIIKTE